MDEASRQRRLRKALEALEQDNFQADPHADLKMSKKAPKFDESMESVPGNQPSSFHNLLSDNTSQSQRTVLGNTAVFSSNRWSKNCTRS